MYAGAATRSDALGDKPHMTRSVSPLARAPVPVAWRFSARVAPDEEACLRIFYHVASVSNTAYDREPLPMAEVYIHGFSKQEQARLVEQARVLAPGVFEGLDFSGVEDLLEIGCGVGAELHLLAQRWPQLHLTGLDRSAAHLAAAKRFLPDTTAAKVRLVRGDALSLPFAEQSFDRVITIWMLEHVRDAAAILREALRVTRPTGRVICTEVDNATFGFDPPNPVIEGWWQRFNRYQQAAGGDPFVGSKLAEVAREIGGEGIEARTLPIIDSALDAGRRAILLDYLRDLLLSGADNLIAGGYA